MNNYDPYSSDYYEDASPEPDTRTRNLRIALFGIILTTIPFYLIGVVLLTVQGMNADRGTVEETEPSVLVSASPIGGELTPTRTLRPTETRDATATPRTNVRSTPYQFVPPPPTNTPTVFIVPTNTTAPTLTPRPTDKPEPTDEPEPTIAPPTATPTETSIPIVETEEPIVETQDPVVETQEPIVETQEPVIETQEPIVETQEPVVETQEPIVETQEPVNNGGTDNTEQGGGEPVEVVTDEPIVENSPVETTEEVTSE